MNSSKVVLSVLLCVLPVGCLSAGLFRAQESVQKIFDIKAAHKDNLKNLEAEQKAFEESASSFEDDLKNEIDKINIEVAKVRSLLDRNAADEFLKKKQAIIGDDHTTLTHIQRSNEQIKSLLSKRIDTTKKLLEVSTKKKIEKKPFHTFEDLQKLRTEILSKKNTIEYFKIQERHVEVELENREKSLSALEKSYAAKKEKFNTPNGEKETGSMFGFTPQQREDLFTIESRLYNRKKQLYELRLKEITHKIDLVAIKKRMAKSELEILNEQVRTVQVRVTESDVVTAKAALSEKHKKIDIENRQRVQKIDHVNREIERLKRALFDLSKQANIPIDSDIRDWTREAKANPGAHVALYKIGVLSTKITLLERHSELLQAKTTLANQRLTEDRVLVDIKETHYRINTGKLKTDQEIKKYEVVSSEVRANISRFKDKRHAARNFLNIQKKTQATLKNRAEKLPELRTTVFRGSVLQHDESRRLLEEALNASKKLMDIVVNLGDVYADIILAMEGTQRHVDSINKRLTALGLWRPAEYALRWKEGLKNIVPDIKNFAREVRGIVRSWMLQMTPVGIMAYLSGMMSDPLTLVVRLIMIIFLFGFFWIVIMYLPRLAQSLAPSDEQRNRQRMRFFLSSLVSFFARYSLGFFAWLILLLGVQVGIIENPSLHVLFYLASVPYLLYFSNRFIRYLSDVNKANNYIFLGESFEGRFFVVFSILIYASISILFLREAFTLATYHKTQLPKLLLALNFIIVQVALISLITKEQILSIIPTKTDMWEWVRTQVNTYYYLILIAVVALIVFSNPYVGYGRLVLFLLSGSVKSAILIWVAFILHSMLKKLSLRIFFYSDEGIVRERFSYSKTWYGVSVIGVYLVLLLFCFVIGSQIWGRPIGIADIMDIFNKELLEIGDKAITAKSLFSVFVFLGGGFFVAFAVNRFVLRRVFDLLLVDAGIQNTVSSLTRYLIFIIAIFFGFQKAGLQDLGTLFYASILGIAWVLREAIADFVSYFIILVQRPLKVGDLIKMDNEMIGVVRKITARSVILRRKNSVTLLIPNSHIITKTITNWNYSRNFIAFNDISLTIPYDEDPQKVKDILLHVLDEHPNVLKTPKPVIRLNNFADYGFVFMIRGFVSSSYTLEIWDIASDIRFAAVLELRKHNIKIASPTRIVRFIGGQNTNNASSLDEGAPTDEGAPIDEGPSSED